MIMSDDSQNQPDGDPHSPPPLIEGLDIDLGIVVSDARWEDELRDADILAERAAVAALSGARETLPQDGLERGFEITIVLADDTTVQQLNRDYRGKDKPTNVLSFALTEGNDAQNIAPHHFPDDDPDSAGPVVLGDVILALETVQREASEQQKSLADHTQHLIVHGVLHLLGWDHIDDNEATAMEARETSILAQMGIGDPYATTFSPHDDEQDGHDDRRAP